VSAFVEASHADIAIVGAGAAGLFAAIHAARLAPRARIVALDSARTLGAKILVAGGGRCNVTHRAVSERDYFGGSRQQIRRVLRRFGVRETVAFFASCGVDLKEEETGKLFPTTDKARTVLDALVGAASAAGVEVVHPCRVESITPAHVGEDRLLVQTASGSLAARRVIIATGGKSLPKSGSDGSGYALAQALGHSLTPLVLPALVPLTLPGGHWILSLSGLALDARVHAVAASGERLHSCEGAVLCTHFGLSGPAILDISRHWLHAAESDAEARIEINWLPRFSPETLDAHLLSARGTSVSAAMHGLLPERFFRALCTVACVDPAMGVQQVSRAARLALVRLATACELRPSGTRGFVAAETTAGGVPLDEVDLATMNSVCCPRLHLCGEILDVDGRIGGFSFQWAWATGFIAGSAAAAALTQTG